MWKKYFTPGDTTPCKENKKWDNAAWNNATQQQQQQQQSSISYGGVGSPPQQTMQTNVIPGGNRGTATGQDGRPLSTQAPIQPSGAGNTAWIGAPSSRGVPQSQPASSKSKANSLFNEQIMTQVLANKNLIPSDINLSLESQSNFLRIGKSFMSDVAHIRNLALPNIDNHDYESLGRIIAKIKLAQKEKTTGTHGQVMTMQLTHSINNILAGSRLSSSQVDWKTSKQTVKMSTTGMYGDDSNALIGKGDKAVKHHEDPDGGLCLWADCDKSKNKPYDSIWSLY